MHPGPRDTRQRIASPLHATPPHRHTATPPPRLSCHPSSHASSLSPRKSPLRLTLNRCRCLADCPPLLADATKARHLASCQPVPCTSSSTPRPSALTRVCALLDTHMTSYGLIRPHFRMFLYLSFVLDPPLVFASWIPFVFAIGHRPPLLSWTLHPPSRFDIPITYCLQSDHRTPFAA